MQELTKNNEVKENKKEINDENNSFIN